jgi:short-subunit dehydrogenase
VSGASAGIGKEFAHQLAQRGLNVVLVARRRAALDAFASELEAAYKVQVRSIARDLAADGAPARLEELTSNIELGLVVLNAGSLTAGPFLAGDLGQELKLIELNVTSTVEMTHRFGNRLRERGRGGLILLSSVAGYGAFPYQANYAASKAYIASFGLALHEELAPAGIDVLVLAPGPTKTEGFVGAEGIDFTKLPLPAMSPTSVVRAALKGLGRKAIVIPGVMNRISDVLGKYALPRTTSARMFGKLLAKALTAHPSQ